MKTVIWVDRMSRRFYCWGMVENDADAQAMQDDMKAHGFAFDFKVCHADEVFRRRSDLEKEGYKFKDGMLDRYFLKKGTR